MKLRKVVFWLHLISGIVTGIVVLIMSITGVALTYQKQMTAWADKNLYAISAQPGSAPMAASELVAGYLRAQPGGAPTSLTLYSDPAMPASIAAGRNPATFLHPYTGQVLGEGSQGARQFFKVMTDWHRWLALSGERRGVGRAITGACNLAFLFLSVSGLYLWWPSQWTRGILRTIAWFRPGSRGKARDWNWHHVFGFWCLVPLVLVIVSGVVISYPWASRLLYRVAGSELAYQPGPPGSRGPQGPGGGPGARRPELQLDGLDALVENVRMRSEGWKSITVPLSSAGGPTVAFTVEKGQGGQPQHRSTMIMDRETGDFVRTEGYGAMDPGMRARIWMRFVHTGEYYGVAGQTIAGIASAAGVLLVWTGFALTYRRFFAKGRRNESVQGVNV